MSKYLLIGGGAAAKEIVKGLLSLDHEVVVSARDYVLESDHVGGPTILKRDMICESDFREGDVLLDVTTVIVLAGGRMIEGLSQAESLLLGNRRMVEDVDAETIMRVLEIRELFRSEMPSSNVRVIAEMIEEDNKKLFFDAGVSEIISPDSLLEKIMVQMVFNEGVVSELVLKLLSKNDKAYLTTITVSDDQMDEDLVGKTYDDLLMRLLDRDVQLIAIIKSQEMKSDDAHSISTENWIINPVSKSDVHYPVRTGDHLIVLRAAAKSTEP